ncbi:MAG TPA: hypothetical protein PLE11_11910, partial [Bacteroidales bacterium]|nr:hypothetical protein [Bacteroidales bacterium]
HTPTCKWKKVTKPARHANAGYNSGKPCQNAGHSEPDSRSGLCDGVRFEERPARESSELENDIIQRMAERSHTPACKRKKVTKPARHAKACYKGGKPCHNICFRALSPGQEWFKPTQ